MRPFSLFHQFPLFVLQNDQLIQEFKAVHNTYNSLKKNLKSVQEMQKDIKGMEEEREQISEKLSTIKRKVRQFLLNA